MTDVICDNKVISVTKPDNRRRNDFRQQVFDWRQCPWAPQSWDIHTMTKMHYYVNLLHIQHGI